MNTGGVTLGRQLRVIGPNVEFHLQRHRQPESTCEGTSILIPEITGADHSPLKTTGTAILGGTVQTDFNGVTPTLGQSWNIIDAAAVNRTHSPTFGRATVPCQGRRPAHGGAHRQGGINGQLAQLFVQQLPVLNG